MYKILVEGGANVNSKDSDGRTPLMLAESRDDTEATEFLLAHGAKLQGRLQASKTATHKEDHNTRDFEKQHSKIDHRTPAPPQLLHNKKTRFQDIKAPSRMGKPAYSFSTNLHLGN
jgi:hypothetical protein